MNKQVFTLSKVELLEVLGVELSRVQELKKYKEVKKVGMLLSMVESATFESVKVEGVRGNSDNRIMVNAGSLVECLVKSHFKGYSELRKSFNQDTSDYINGFVDYEIKASLPNARNTALKEPKSLILVNCLGAYFVKKSESMKIPTDSKGKFYENMDYSVFDGVRRIKTLSNSLGL